MCSIGGRRLFFIYVRLPKHAFDCIIVWKLDRFSRNRYDSAHYKALLRKNGVKVVSAKEAIAEGSEGILLESVLEGFEHTNGHKVFYPSEIAFRCVYRSTVLANVNRKKSSLKI